MQVEGAEGNKGEATQSFPIWHQGVRRMENLPLSYVANTHRDIPVTCPCASLGRQTHHFSFEMASSENSQLVPVLTLTAL